MELSKKYFECLIINNNGLSFDPSLKLDNIIEEFLNFEDDEDNLSLSENEGIVLYPSLKNFPFGRQNQRIMTATPNLEELESLPMLTSRDEQEDDQNNIAIIDGESSLLQV